MTEQKPAFKVVWGSEDQTDAFLAASLDEAKAMCIELLVQWIVDETDDWKYTEQKSLEPTERQVQSYDNMIDTCRAWVVQLTDPDAPDEQRRYTKAWSRARTICAG